MRLGGDRVVAAVCFGCGLSASAELRKGRSVSKEGPRKSSSSPVEPFGTLLANRTRMKAYLCWPLSAGRGQGVKVLFLF